MKYAELYAASDYIFTVPVNALAAIYNPFKASPWDGTSKLNPDAIASAIEQQDFSTVPHDDHMQNPLAPPEQAYHVKRIAYLVAHPDPEPIVIVPNIRGSFQLEDGFHRLAAAIYRHDATINIAFGGTHAQLQAWLGA
jgi:hypothetical protein